MGACANTGLLTRLIPGSRFIFSHGGAKQNQAARELLPDASGSIYTVQAQP